MLRLCRRQQSSLLTHLRSTTSSGNSSIVSVAQQSEIPQSSLPATSLLLRLSSTAVFSVASSSIDDDDFKIGCPTFDQRRLQRRFPIFNRQRRFGIDFSLLRLRYVRQH